MNNTSFQLVSDFSPTGDQPAAIDALVNGLKQNLTHQLLLGVTGSGKTFTLANTIARVNRPCVVLAPNKTLAAQLYGEFKRFFPHNRVEYFVSYYDYYQPEAYIPTTGVFIEKDASVNEHIEQMRLSATKALLEHHDTIIVSSVSAIYGLGSPETYLSMVLHLSRNDKIKQHDIVQRLAQMQYKRNDAVLSRSNYRVRGDIIDIFPAESSMEAIRIELFDDLVKNIASFDPLTGKVIQKVPRITIYPNNHYVTPKTTLVSRISAIKQELAQRLEEFKSSNRLVEMQRLNTRVNYDIEMMLELGYCSGIENYSRYLSGKAAGEPPPTLFNYLSQDAFVVIDESHVTIPQIGAMYKGDRSRKENLVEHGFRLPSALDNRPLRFSEWENIVSQMILVSATPSVYEVQHAPNAIELVVRPTAILDPKVEVRPATNQVDDLLSVIQDRVKKRHRILVTVLTKRLAEELTDYLNEINVKVRYLHSDIDTVERTEILRDLRLGVFDVLVGINLLREGLDLPEVSLVAILDADKEGFLRSERSLIQTIGRAARHVEGCAILYADKITASMDKAIQETKRRRLKQIEYNKQHNLVPTQIYKDIADIMEVSRAKKTNSKDNIEHNIVSAKMLNLTPKQLTKQLAKTEKLMHKAAADLDFEQASMLRDKLLELKQALIS